MDKIDLEYVNAAISAKNVAYAPYSKFRVGAALITKDHKIITGCNIENSSYSLTICAERVALFKAVSEGLTRFSKIYIAAETAECIPPCGACRQVIWDLAGNIQVVMINKNKLTKSFMMQDLLPEAFDKNFFEDV